MFKKMPVILLGVIFLAWGVQSWLPLGIASLLYACSLTIKSVILFLLPFVIFGLLFKTAVQLAKKASTLILFLVVAILFSNFFSTLLSYGVGSFAYHCELSMHVPPTAATLTPAWELSLPQLLGNAQALCLGILLGIVVGRFKPLLAEKLSTFFEKGIHFLLKGVLAAIPLFIAGFVIKMAHEGVLGTLLRNYSLIFLLVGGAVFTYILFLYLLVSRFELPLFLTRLKNMLPAALAGFGSMSSAAALPLTLIGTEKNAENKEVAKAVIPATVNVHLMGDCFAIPIFAFAILKSFGMADPSWTTYLLFAASFVLAKFSVAAVPGGGILVMLPILESHLGFTGEMLSLITALYFLFDPVITCANVLGNGSFALLFSRCYTKGLTQKQNE